MTSFLVASLVLGQLAFPREDAARAGTPQAEAWRTVRHSVAVLPDGLGRPGGVAVLIDDQGVFMAHLSSVVAEPVTALLSNNVQVRLSRLGFDRNTQMVLLKAQTWTEDWRPVVRLANPQGSTSTDLSLVTSNGVLRGTLSSQSVPGLIAETQRFVPLAEVQMESAGVPVGGALLFNRNGELTGVLGATLRAESSRSATPAGGASLQSNAQTFGPRGLTVGYALGPKLLRRVVDGFRSPERRVAHPSIGVFFRAADGDGALIDQVVPGAPADRAGIVIGDRIIRIGDRKIQNHIDLAVELFDHDPGEILEITLLRSGREIQKRVTVGTQPGQA